MQLKKSNLSTSVQYLKGVGPKKAKILEKLNIKTVQDLLTYFPSKYEDRSQLKLIAQLIDETATIRAVVAHHKLIYLPKRKQLLKITVEDGTGKAILNCFNQTYLKATLPVGTTIIIHGKFTRIGKTVQSSNFTYEKITSKKEDPIHTNRIVPIYPLTQNLNIRFLRALIKKTLDEHIYNLKDILPLWIRNRYNLQNYPSSLKEIHFPSSWERLKQARYRLIFEEFFLWLLALELKKRVSKRIHKKRVYEIKKHLLTKFKNQLSFEFTSSQKKVINEIFNDLRTPSPMNRLLQGDVGSGKTVVAVSAMLLVIENGYQSALMAPTEILAEQHYFTLKQMLSGLDLTIDIVVGKQKRKEREKLLQSIKEGNTNIIIGTHALLEQKIKFKNLALIVIDEQHKFGVQQRAYLKKKGENLDTLIMTATPIPRTLGLTLYGDLDISTIDSLPPGRKEILTYHLTEKQAYHFVIKEVEKGRQAYIVYPLINESDKLELKSVMKEASQLIETVFGRFRVGILHGQLKRDQKERIMYSFLNKEIDILITTTVIEVGIDVSNANIIVIENSDRFGLATLHQLRGRVGRSTKQSYCILVGKGQTEQSKRRLDIMLKTTDGFLIAEEDLRIRGVGEFFGTKQHGITELKIGNILTDSEVLEKAKDASKTLIQKDPYLDLIEHLLLKKKFKKEFKNKFFLASVS